MPLWFHNFFEKFQLKYLVKSHLHKNPHLASALMWHINIPITFIFYLIIPVLSIDSMYFFQIGPYLYIRISISFLQSYRKMVGYTAQFVIGNVK